MPKEAGREAEPSSATRRCFLNGPAWTLFGDPVSFEKFTRRIELLETCVPIRDQSGFRDFERKRKILRVIERGRSYFIDI